MPPEQPWFTLLQSEEAAHAVAEAEMNRLNKIRQEEGDEKWARGVGDSFVECTRQLNNSNTGRGSAETLRQMDSMILEVIRYSPLADNFISSMRDALIRRGIL